MKNTILTGVMSIACAINGSWITEAIAPAAAYAYVSRLDITINVQPGESFQTFLHRAEAAARAAAQRSFDRDILITEVYVIIAGQRGGSIAQVLSLQVSRPQWKGRPDPRRWATYYDNAKILLNFGGTTAGGSAPATPTVTQQATPMPQTQPLPRANPPAGSPSILITPVPTDPATSPSPTDTQPNTPINPLIPPAPGTSSTTTPLPPSQPVRSLR